MAPNSFPANDDGDPVIGAIGGVDIAGVAVIHAASFDDAWSESVIREILAMPGTSGLVARNHPYGPARGFALCRIAGGECELLSLAVDPSHRGCGIGGGLLDAVVARAGASGADKLFLEVAEDNKTALGLYRSRGFWQVGRRPGYYVMRSGEAVDALTMCRTLAGATMHAGARSVAGPR